MITFLVILLLSFISLQPFLDDACPEVQYQLWWGSGAPDTLLLNPSRLSWSPSPKPLSVFSAAGLYDSKQLVNYMIHQSFQGFSISVVKLWHLGDFDRFTISTERPRFGHFHICECKLTFFDAEKMQGQKGSPSFFFFKFYFSFSLRSWLGNGR